MSSVSSVYSSRSGLSSNNDESGSRPEYQRRYGPESDYQWQIENFSMCPQKKGETLVSTSFTVDSLDQSEFRLVLYPRGQEGDAIENVACFIECLNESDFNVRIVISIMVNKSPFVTKTKENLVLSSGKRIGFALLPDRQELVTRRFALLPQDVLTIRCIVTPEYRAPYVCDEDFLDISKEYGNLLRSGKFSDFVIIGPAKEEIPVHKVILTIRCNELAKKFGLMDDNPASEATIDDISVPVLKAILNYLYSGNLPEDLTPEMLNEIYEVAKTLKMDDLKRDVFPVETCTIACTTIKVNRRFISWGLPDFHQRMETKDWPMRAFIDLTLGRFILSFYVKEGGGKLITQIDIYCHSLMLDASVLVKCTVQVDNGEGGPKPELCSGEHWFEAENDATVLFSMTGDHDLLYAWKSLKKYPEKVGLVFEFALSNPLSCTSCRKVEVNNTLKAPTPIYKLSYQRLSSDLDIVFRDTCYEDDDDSDSDRDPGTFSDLIIKSESGKLILSHRCILSARSVLFHELIESDGVGRTCNNLNLSDMSDVTLMDLLRYVYSGKIKDRNLDQVIALYIAASKYKVLALMKRCAHFMKTEMTVSDVYRLLLLADEHQDDNLFDILLGFIQLNQKYILNSEGWKRIVMEKPQLASKTLSELSSMIIQRL